MSSSFAPARALVALAILASGSLARADQVQPSLEPGKPNTPPELLDVGVSESLDTKLPLEAKFLDHKGKFVKLGDLIDGVHPTVVIFAYHSCPTLCSLVQEGVVKAMRGVDWSLGEQYNAITISIDPKETLEASEQKRRMLVGMYGRPVSDKGWSFLTSPDNDTIEEVARYAGWRYYYNEQAKQYAHPAAVVLLKPSGKIARYLYGVEIDPKDMRLGLIEASEGKSVSTMDRALLYCFQYDGKKRTYTMVATRVMQVGGGVTVLALGSFLGVMWMRERRKKIISEKPEKQES